MSHFSVLVIGPNVDEQLAPYHEFECTGIDDKYVKTIDKTAEYRQQYERSTEDMLLEKATGKRYSFFTEDGMWDPRFSTPEDPSERVFPVLDLGRKKKFVPPGFKEIEVPTTEVQTFAKFIEGWAGHKPVAYGEQPDLQGDHKYGYTLLDRSGEVIASYDRTNQNKKWDWYAIGGRWSGFFKLKPEFAQLSTQHIGEPGAFGRYREDVAGHADQFTKRMIDIEAMRDEAAQNAAKEWDETEAILERAGAPRAWEPWPTHEWWEANPKADHAKIRATYNAQPAIKALNDDREFSMKHWGGLDVFLMPRDAFIKRARDRALCTYAVVCKGEWVGRGEMGWFGCDDKLFEEDEWIKMFNELIEGLPDDTQLTVVDAHI